MVGIMKDIKDETGYEVEELDIGGGFGIRYIEEHKGRRTADRYATHLVWGQDNLMRRGAQDKKWRLLQNLLPWLERLP